MGAQAFRKPVSGFVNGGDVPSVETVRLTCDKHTAVDEEGRPRKCVVFEMMGSPAVVWPVAEAGGWVMDGGSLACPRCSGKTPVEPPMIVATHSGSRTIQ